MIGRRLKMPRISRKAVDYEISSSNVYADLGFADSAEMLAKARIVAQIGHRRRLASC
jgi:hypothetical protein